MTAINTIVLDAADDHDAAKFYRSTFGTRIPVLIRESDAASEGFRGFTIGFDVASPSAVDEVYARAIKSGAFQVKLPKRQMWGGYSGVVRTPDDAVVKIATTEKKSGATDDTSVQRTVLLLGVADVKASKLFYVDHGLAVAKSYGSKYVEFEPQGGNVTLGLYKRAGLAKEFGVPSDGTGSSRLTVHADVSPFADPDGFEWGSAGVEAGR